MPHCRFRGAFTPEERNRIDRAVTSIEQEKPTMRSMGPTWLIMRATPAAGVVYVGVRFRDGQVVRASTVRTLIDGFAALGRSEPPGPVDG